jgi:hypothetical protein
MRKHERYIARRDRGRSKPLSAERQGRYGGAPQSEPDPVRAVWRPEAALSMQDR